MSYWQVFRITFVLFQLYLIGEMFYRWDGFIYYYASFSGFIPTFALVATYFTGIAVFAAMCVWLSARVLQVLCVRIGCKVKVEHSQQFVSVFILLGLAVWIMKREYMPSGITLQQKLIAIACIGLVTLLMTWMCRKKIANWIDLIQNRITPLVSLFGIFVVLSVLLVAYSLLFV